MISRVVKESSDSLFPGERRLISLQYSEMLSIFTLSLPLARHVLHGVQSCETSTKHPRSARGNFIPILKITRDELPTEQGVYRGCLLCPLYPFLVFGIKTNVVPSQGFFLKQCMWLSGNIKKNAFITIINFSHVILEKYSLKIWTLYQLRTWIFQSIQGSGLTHHIGWRHPFQASAISSPIS